MWRTFLDKDEIAQAANESRIKLFEEFIRKEIEAIVSQRPQELKHASGEIRVSHITFAFNNVPVIKLLQERGNHITRAEPLKVAEVDAKLNSMKIEHLERITRPVAAFITFETQEGFERAKELTGKKNWKDEIVSSEYTLLGEPLSMTQAPEPTNIIWENRDKSFQTKLKRKFIVVAIIIILLLGAFLAFYFLKRTTITNYRKYPPTTDCKSIIKMFGSDFQDKQF